MRKILIAAGAASLGCLFVAGSGHAGAADLTCLAPSGVAVDGPDACGVNADPMSRAYARSIDAVAFARADRGGGAMGLAHDGAVAAAETIAGQVGAAAVGPDAVSIVSADPGAFAIAVSLAGGQTFVGTTAEGVRCDAGPGFALNFSNGQFCLSDGITTWTTFAPVP